MGGGGACALALGGVMGDMIKPLGDATKGFGGSAFPSAMDFGKDILCVMPSFSYFLHINEIKYPDLAIFLVVVVVLHISNISSNLLMQY